jgi:hypothetical protein
LKTCRIEQEASAAGSTENAKNENFKCEIKALEAIINHKNQTITVKCHQDAGKQPV